MRSVASKGTCACSDEHERHIARWIAQYPSRPARDGSFWHAAISTKSVQPNRTSPVVCSRQRVARQYSPKTAHQSEIVALSHSPPSPRGCGEFHRHLPRAPRGTAVVGLTTIFILVPGSRSIARSSGEITSNDAFRRQCLWMQEC